MAITTPLPGAASPSVAAAVEVFLAARHLAAGFQRVYRLTLTGLAEALGADRGLDELHASEVASATERCWPDVAPATWSVVATVTSWARCVRARAGRHRPRRPPRAAPGAR